MKRRYRVIQDLRQILKVGEILIEHPENVLRRENAKDTDGSLSRELFGEEFEDYLELMTKRIVAYCDGSFDSDSTAVGIASMFNLGGLQKAEVFGDASPTMDSTKAEIYAILLTAKHVTRELNGTVFNNSDTHLVIYSDSLEAAKHIEKASAGYSISTNILARQAYGELSTFSSYDIIHVARGRENTGPHYMSNCHVDKLAKRAMHEARSKIRSAQIQQTK